MITKINESIVWHDGRPCKVSETPVEASPWKTMAGEICRRTTRAPARN